MKKIKSIFRYLFTIVLAVSLMIFFAINIMSFTIMDKNFILNKLEETGYYDKVYGYATENFKNYIIQSGLEESVLEGIITREDVVEDTNRIINNIYSNIDEQIDANKLKTKLNENIKVSTQGMILTTEQQNSLNSFVDEIAKEYLNSIAHFDFEKALFNGYHKLSFIIDIANKVILIFIAVSLFGLIFTCGRRIYKLFSYIGIAILSNGLLFIIVNIFINLKINVQTLTILNDAFSFTLREIVSSILEQLSSKGILMTIFGVLLIIISNLIHNFLKYKNDDDED